MASLTVPASVRQYISRARSLFKRDEPLRGIESLTTGLELYDPSALLGKARFEAEVIIQECVLELNQQQQVKTILAELTKSSSFTIAYVPGEEAKLKQILALLKKAIESVKVQEKQQAADAVVERRKSLENRAKDYLANGDGPLAKATLRNLGEEFGEEPGVFTQIGQWLMDADYKFEALEFFESAIATFPKDHRAYKGATTCAMELREADKAVELYTLALRQFGKHPTTLLNLAKAYEMAHNREKAFEYASAAAKADPGNKEAKAMAEKYA